MVTPDFPVPINNDRAPECLRNITPYLNVAEIFDCDQVRVGMKKDEDVVWAQRAADEARERKIRLVHHAEANTLFATFDVAFRTLKRVNRKNLGYLHDECQWMVNTNDYRPDRIVSNMKAIAPWIWNVYIKNQVSGPGPVNRPEIQLSEPGGVDWNRHFEGLNEIRYTGYVTVHESNPPYGSPMEAAVRCSRISQAVYLATFPYVTEITRGNSGTSRKRVATGTRRIERGRYEQSCEIAAHLSSGNRNGIRNRDARSNRRGRPGACGCPGWWGRRGSTGSTASATHVGFQ